MVFVAQHCQSTGCWPSAPCCDVHPLATPPHATYVSGLYRHARAAQWRPGKPCQGFRSDLKRHVLLCSVVRMPARLTARGLRSLQMTCGGRRRELAAPRQQLRESGQWTHVESLSELDWSCRCTHCCELSGCSHSVLCAVAKCTPRLLVTAEASCASPSPC